jgi:small multidrug resistance family-3 protein
LERLLIIDGLFVLAGLCEIGGGYLVWGWMREHKPVLCALLGAVILATYGVVAALQPISGPVEAGGHRGGTGSQ